VKPTDFSAIEAGWTAEDWDIARNERAGVLEYDEQLPRYRAEDLATAQTVKRYGYRPKETK
jgi:hypothetical protein